MATDKIAGYAVLPRGYKVIEGTKMVQKAKRSRKRYKMSKAARNKIAASARRFKLPVLTLGAVALGTWEPIQMLTQGQGKLAGQILLRNYTGFNVDGNGGVEFKFRYLMNGLLPLTAVMLINRSGILKPVNQKLAKSPLKFLRLS